MDELAEIGRTVRADRSSEDVTTEVIDVDSRVATAEASLARLQRFLRQAERVEDMIRLESEIATRQAELESMKAQQTYLRDQTSLATITVRLRTPDAPPAAPPDDAGFLTGLTNGWAALRTVLVGLATVTGAMLPFVVAIGVLAVPALLLVRTARRRRQPAAPPPAPEAG
jgi:Flp pilus assembly protein TadB